jgi:hypothetical protein
MELSKKQRKNLVEVLNNPVNLEIIRENQEFSKEVNDLYIKRSQELYKECVKEALPYLF